MLKFDFVTHAALLALAVILTMTVTSHAALADPDAATPLPPPQLHSGDRVAFLGASITEYGWTHPGGYVKQIVAGFAASGIDIVPIPAGVSGNTSRQMLARVQRDVIDKKADWVFVDAGGNDVWHNGVQFPEYMRNMTQIVSMCQTAGIHVVLQTCTPLFEDLGNDFNKKLSYYNDFQRYLAEERGCYVADQFASAAVVIQAKTTADNVLTVDGVHMNDRGNQLMAACDLALFGVKVSDGASLPLDNANK